MAASAIAGFAGIGPSITIQATRSAHLCQGREVRDIPLDIQKPPADGKNATANWRDFSTSRGQFRMEPYTNWRPLDARLWPTTPILATHRS
jgi:hypothetical protein